MGAEKDSVGITNMVTMMYRMSQEGAEMAIQERCRLCAERGVAVGAAVGAAVGYVHGVR